MQINSRPMLLFFLLLALLAFLVGFRFGRRVEQMDKTYVPPSPTAVVTPSDTPAPTELPLEFITYQNKTCGFNFVHPKYLLEEKISSESANLTGKDSSIFYECNKTAVFNKKDAVSELDPEKEVTVKIQKIKLYRKDDRTTMFIILNPALSRSVFFEVSDNLTDLVLKTLEFNTK